jgi:hypothetical protein
MDKETKKQIKTPAGGMSVMGFFTNRPDPCGNNEITCGNSTSTLYLFIMAEKSSMVFYNSFASSLSSTTSTRLSPDSIFETKDWGRSSFSATST